MDCDKCIIDQNEPDICCKIGRTCCYNCLEDCPIKFKYKIKN